MDKEEMVDNLKQAAIHLFEADNMGDRIYKRESLRKLKEAFDAVVRSTNGN